MQLPTPLYRTLALVTASALAQAAVAQSLSLQDAVDRAIEVSLVVEQGELQLAQDQVTLRTTELSRYPSVSLGGSGGYQFGRTIDPVTNDFVSQEIGTNSFNLSAGVPLYQGGLIRRSLAQNRADIAASEATLEDLRQDVALDAAEAYLNVLLTEEQLLVAEANLEAASQAARRADALARAGQLAEADRYEPAALAASREQESVIARNAVASARLTLRQLLQLGSGETLNIPRPDSSIFEDLELPAISPEELFAGAVDRQPSVRAAMLSEAAAEAGIAVARSGFLPTISAFGQLRTNASTQAFSFPTFTGETEIVDQTFIINGEPVVVGVPQAQQVQNPDPTYFDQLQENFGQSFGLQFNVPIFSNGQNQAAVERAELAVAQASLDVERERQVLENEIQQAYQAAVAARAEVEATERSLAFRREAFRVASRRAELGAGSAFDLTNAQILLEQAEVALLRARYQFLFNAKVVDFYLGNPLTLD